MKTRTKSCECFYFNSANNLLFFSLFSPDSVGESWSSVAGDSCRYFHLHPYRTQTLSMLG